MGNESLEKVIDDIRSGMTGDSEKDVIYLRDLGYHYKDHELCREIARELELLIFAIDLDGLRKEFIETLCKDAGEMRGVLDSAYSLLANGNADGACDAILPHATKLLNLERSTQATANEHGTSFRFACLEEELLFRRKKKIEGDVRIATEPYVEVYYCTAECLRGAGRLDESIEWLERAIEWNPASTRLYLELAETYRRKGEIDKAEQAADRARPYAYKPKLFAQLLRFKSLCKVDRGELELAGAYIGESMRYDTFGIAPSELTCLDWMLDLDPSCEHGAEMIRKIGDPIELDGNVTETFVRLIVSARESGDDEALEIGARAMWDITNDDRYFDMLEPTIRSSMGYMRKFTPLELEPTTISVDDYINGHDDEIVERFNAIIQHEAPIEKRRLCNLVRESFGIKRSGKKVQERSEAMLKRAPYRTTKWNGTEFVWLKNQDPSKFGECRRFVGASRPGRNADQIPYEEIRAAILSELCYGRSKNEDELVRAAAESFGYAHVASRIRTVFTKAIKKAEQEGYISESVTPIGSGEDEPRLLESSVERPSNESFRGELASAEICANYMNLLMPESNEIIEQCLALFPNGSVTVTDLEPGSMRHHWISSRKRHKLSGDSLSELKKLLVELFEESRTWGSWYDSGYWSAILINKEGEKFSCDGSILWGKVETIDGIRKLLCNDGVYLMEGHPNTKGFLIRGAAPY